MESQLLLMRWSLLVSCFVLLVLSGHYKHRDPGQTRQQAGREPAVSIAAAGDIARRWETAREFPQDESIPARAIHSTQGANEATYPGTTR